jgi:hypothetical protein
LNGFDWRKATIQAFTFTATPWVGMRKRSVKQRWPASHRPNSMKKHRPVLPDRL